jgi:hypothetical protein
MVCDSWFLSNEYPLSEAPSAKRMLNKDGGNGLTQRPRGYRHGVE